MQVGFGNIHRQLVNLALFKEFIAFSTILVKNIYVTLFKITIGKWQMEGCDQ